MKICIASSREIGLKCFEWAKENLPEGVELSDMDSSEIFISVMYDELVSPEFIKSKKDCFNFHPGILPEYRGAGAFSWAIINQEKRFGITLHKIDAGIDSGNIIDIKRFPITEKDTAYSLFEKGERIIFEMFKEWFPRLITGHYISRAQYGDRAKLYYRKDLSQAKNLTRFARAFHFPEKEQAYYFDKKGKKIFLKYDSWEGIKGGEKRYDKFKEVNVINIGTGFLVWKWGTADNVEIEDIEVTSNERRKGSGTKLVRLLLDELKDEPPKIVFVYTKSNNTTAQGFYTALGFIKGGEMGDNWLYSAPYIALQENKKINEILR